LAVRLSARLLAGIFTGFGPRLLEKLLEAFCGF